MRQPSMTVGMQTLIDHAEWVQELARKLVRDPDLAEDLAQETLLTALQGRATPVRATRAWLGAVLRNLLWQRLRRDQRRRSRERHASREETTPSSAELVERMSAHREVVNAVMALPEHYRLVLLHRYFEGETPTGIAARLEMPVSTVKTRLARALDLLRQRLDDDHGGDGRGWVTALAPLLGGPQTAPTPPPPPRALLVGAATAVMVAAVALAWPEASPAPAPVGRTGAGVPAARAAASEDPADPFAGEPPARSPLAVTTEVLGPVPTDLMSAPRPLRGLAFDADGIPRAGVVLAFTPLSRRTAARGTAIGVSGAEGTFEIPRAVGTGIVKAANTDLVTVLAGMAIGESKDDLRVVVARRQSLTGTVTDPHGVPLSGVRIELQPPADLAMRTGTSLQNAQLLRFREHTGADGRFELPRVPDLGGTLEVRREGFWSHTVPQPAGSEAVLHLSLQRPVPRSGSIVGHVVGADGTPLEDVRVSVGWQVTRTDAGGRFVLDPAPRRLAAGDARQAARVAPATRLIAARAGMLPAFLDAPVDPRTGEPAWPERIELVLDGEPRALTGRVVSPEGRGLAGMHVWIDDPTVFALPPREPGQGYETRRYDAEELAYPDPPEVLESYLAGEAHRPWRWVKTDAEGAFRIENLADRAYRVAVMDPETLVHAESEAEVPGTAVTLTLDPGSVHSVTGRVVDRGGRAVAGARVQAQRAAFHLRFQGRVVQTSNAACAMATTGPDGAFSLHDVARDSALRVEGPGIVPSVHAVGPVSFAGTIEVTVARQLQMQVHANPDADGIGVRDRDDNSLTISVIQGSQRQMLRRAPLIDGRSEVLSVPDHAETLELWSGGRLLRRLPLQLRAGRVNHIRL